MHVYTSYLYAFKLGFDLELEHIKITNPTEQYTLFVWCTMIALTNLADKKKRNMRWSYISGGKNEIRNAGQKKTELEE